ncbi:MAG TPA: secretin N-terminal domain-containing protein [Gemmatimonadaceae bacterium]|nr:secretin N-terminal domain-containing protein [Gemmatimonadaceae bacterium]
MRRFWSLAGIAALALSAVAPAAHAITLNDKRTGEVTALSVVSAAGRAEVIIGVGGDVEVSDFTLGTPPRVVLDVRGARLTMPPRLYDRVARGGVSNVRVAQYQEDVVRIVIDLAAEHDYTVTRGDGEVRIAIMGGAATFTAWHAAAPELVIPAAAPAAPAAVRQSNIAAKTVQQSQQPRITVTYQDADIRDVLAAFAAFSGRTIVVGKGVAGDVTAEVRDQPWDVALRAILQSQGLAAQTDGSGIITVDSYGNIAAQQALEPLTTRILPVNYARAGSLVETIRMLLSKDCLGAAAASGTPTLAGQAGCMTRGSVTADTATNRLVITDVPSRLAEILQYVSELDIRTPQVAIKAKIIFVNRTDIEDLGLSYDFGSQTQFFNKLVQRPDPSTFSPIDSDGDGIPDGTGGGTPYNENVNIIDLGGSALSAIANANARVVQPALQLVFSAAIGKFDLTTFLDALQEVRLADIQAEPSIVTLDNREASILVGEETPIRVIDASSAGGATGEGPSVARATVTFKETGIILRVTPHITANRQILMQLHSERSNLVAAASDLGYTFQKQEAKNQLLVADGETAVIGGLTVTQVTTSKSGIPILVDLPLIGRLFGTTRRQEEKRDLLILVTPHIIDDGEQLGPPSGR